MKKLIALALCALSLAACSDMNGTRSMGYGNATRNSSDANRSGNPAAVSPTSAGSNGNGGNSAPSGSSGSTGASGAGSR
jgi:hypothetical protein